MAAKNQMTIAQSKSGRPQGYEFPCSQCGGDAMIGYTAGRRKGSDWNGKVKRGERLCTACFQRRGGERFI